VIVLFVLTGYQALGEMNAGNARAANAQLSRPDEFFRPKCLTSGY
jgi:hypothetical protein